MNRDNKTYDASVGKEFAEALMKNFEGRNPECLHCARLRLFYLPEAISA